MKKLKGKISAVLAALMSFNLCCGMNVMGNSNNGENVRYYGDIDGSGAVDISDLTKISLYLLGDYNMPDTVIPIMDFNANGMVDLADMAALKQYIMKEDVYPIGMVYVTEEPPVTSVPVTEATTTTTTTPETTLPPVTTPQVTEATTVPTIQTTEITTVQTTQPSETLPPAKDYPSDPQGYKQERQVEYLDRGLIATETGSGMLVSWRLLGTDRESTYFKLYKDGVLIYTADQNRATAYLDKSGNKYSRYTLETYQGTEKTESSELTAVLEKGYMDIPLEKPGYDYMASDCSVGDVDGDGEYEIFVKWDPADAKDNSQEGVTGNVFIDCYTLKGKKLWRIDLGRNIRAGAHYTQFMVYDFDGDGKSEMICKTADGTVDGKGKPLTYDTKSYGNQAGYILEGNEYLTVFNGQTGEAMSTINYNPARGEVSSWGDKYGNRCDRFLAGVAYLDGKTPSVIMCRGYYTRAVLVAYDWDGRSLKQRWIFDSTDGGTDSKGKPNSDYSGQGNHNLSVADVDNDGFDEIIYGSCCIDHNGRGLYSTKLNHGDALHVGDFIPYRPGLEVWQCHESSPFGCTLRDAENGNIIFRYTADKDTGRCAAGNILAGNNTAEFWGSRGAGVYDGAGNVVGSQKNVAVNFLIYWDGDLESELLDGTTISKYNGNGVDTLLSGSGVASCNDTKSTPNLSADIFGDWREELILHTTDSSALRIYSTTYTTDLRMFTLMHDTQYRTAIAWQNTAYNQPPHASFFMGTDFKLPSFPFVYQAKK